MITDNDIDCVLVCQHVYMWCSLACDYSRANMQHLTAASMLSFEKAVNPYAMGHTSASYVRPAARRPRQGSHTCQTYPQRRCMCMQQLACAMANCSPSPGALQHNEDYKDLAAGLQHDGLHGTQHDMTHAHRALSAVWCSLPGLQDVMLCATHPNASHMAQVPKCAQNTGR